MGVTRPIGCPGEISTKCGELRCGQLGNCRTRFSVDTTEVVAGQRSHVPMSPHGGGRPVSLNRSRQGPALIQQGGGKNWRAKERKKSQQGWEKLKRKHGIV